MRIKLGVMKRREFLKLSTFSILSAAVFSSAKALVSQKIITKPDTPNDLYYPLRGNAFDTVADGESHYNHMPFEQLADDIERFRMPRKWTEARMLNLQSEGIIS